MDTRYWILDSFDWFDSFEYAQERIAHHRCAQDKKAGEIKKTFTHNVKLRAKHFLDSRLRGNDKENIGNDK